MSQRIKALICLALVFCLAAGIVPACAAGGHSFATDTPIPETTATPEPSPTPTPTPSPTPTPAPDSTPTSEPISEPETVPDQGILFETYEDEQAGLMDVAQPAPGEEPDPAPAEVITEPEAPAEATEIPQESSDAEKTVLDLPTGGEMIDPSRYVFALHKREEAYNPASVLISGILLVPADTEILSATVTVAGGKNHEIPGSEILRTTIGSEPVSAQNLTFEPDRERAGFAFLADLSEDGLADGETNVSVILTTDRMLSLETTVKLDSGMGKYLHAIMAVYGRCLALTNQGDHVDAFQQRLQELGYLKEGEISGIIDEKTMAAAKELLGRYQRDAGNSYLNSEEVGFILSDRPEPKPEGEDGLPAKILGFFRGTVLLFDKEIPVWMLTAAGAALILIILVIILLITGRKRKARRQEKEASTMNELSRRSAFITGQEESEQAAQILSIGDEPTMDLAEEEAAGGLVYSADEATTDLNTPLYTVKLRLIYSGQYMDTAVRLQDGGEAVIGRGEGVQVQTNPADTSVSHRHGMFAVRNGMATYTDNSRNGTRYNGQRTLHKGESVNIPFNTKVQMDIGNHKVLVIAAKN